MNIRQLSYFLTVCRCGSIKKAAEELVISQQALSKTIILLEKELNTQLFVRSNNKLELTNEARLIQESAARIIEEWRWMLSRNPQNKVPWPALTVYIVENFMDILGVAFWKAFYDQYPQICLNLMQVTEERAVEKLQNDKAELAILSHPLDPSVYENHFLYRQAYWVLVRRDDPLAQKEVIAFRDLDGRKIATYGRDYPYYVATNTLLQDKNIKVQTVLETNCNDWIVQIAEKGLAVGVVLGNVAEKIQSRDLVVRPQKDPVYVSYYLCHKVRPELSPEARRFRRFLMGRKI